MAKKQNSPYANIYKNYENLPAQARCFIVRALLSNTITGTDAQDILEYAQYCQSPIEIIFLIAYEIICIYLKMDYLVLDIQLPIECQDRTYIADFAFDTEFILRDYYTPEHDFKLVIECDGYEYHNATKEQVAYDNERNIAIKKEGFDIIHFSGSQIVKNPWKCAKEAIDYILSKIGKVSKGGYVDLWEEKIQREKETN